MRRRRRARRREAEWWEYHRNLSDLYYWLSERGDMQPDQAGHFLEKPWKWDAEFALYRRWLAGENCPAADCPFLVEDCPSHMLHQVPSNGR